MDTNPSLWSDRDLSDVLIDMVVSADPETTIKQMLVWCIEQTSGVYGALFLYDPSQETLRYTVSHGVPSKWDEQLRSRPPWRLGERIGITGWVASTQEPLYIADVLDDANWIDRSQRIRSAFWVPLVVGHQLYGVFNICAQVVDGLSVNDRLVILRIARYASLALLRMCGTERARMYDQREESLASMLLEMEQNEHPDEVTRVGLQLLIQLGGMDAGAVFSRQPSGEIRLDEMIGDYPPVVVTQMRQLLATNRTMLVSQSFATREAVEIEDYVAWPDAIPSLVMTGLQSCVYVPALYHEHVSHVLGLFSFRRKVSLPANLANWMQVAAARVTNVYVHLQARQEIDLSKDMALEAIAQAMELRDFEAFGHVRRVTQAAVQMASMISVDADFLQSIRWGALLHDVGKLAVSDAILLKPGPLTAEEKQQVERHPVLGMEVLKRMTYLPKVTTDIILHHHERWDGQGYPYRLAGEEIPLSARLFAVVDTYDALISQRPYKTPWTPERAREFIQESAGTRFDPEMVELFMAGDLGTDGTGR